MDPQEPNSLQTQSLFLSLPKEIRLLIYEELCQNTLDTLVPQRSTDAFGKPAYARGVPEIPAAQRLDFLLTCRQVYAESHQLAYRSTVFSITVWSTEYSNSRPVASYRNKPPPNIVTSKIRRLMLLSKLRDVRPSTAALLEHISLVALTERGPRPLTYPPKEGWERISNVKYVSLQDSLGCKLWVRDLVEHLPRLRCIVLVIYPEEPGAVIKAKQNMCFSLPLWMAFLHNNGKIVLDHVKLVVRKQGPNKGRACIGLKVKKDTALRAEFGDVKHVHLLICKEPKAPQRLHTPWLNECPEGETFAPQPNYDDFSCSANGILRYSGPGDHSY